MSGLVPSATEAVEQPGGPLFQHVCQPFIPAAGHPNQRYPRPDPGGVLSGRVHSDWRGSAAESLRVMHMDGSPTAIVSLDGNGLNVEIELSPRNLRKAARLLLDCAYDMDGRADDPQPQPTQVQPARVAPTFDLLAHLQRHIEFSLRTFGPGDRTKGVCDHIGRELKEVLDAFAAGAPTLPEWVDVIILGLDGAWRSGATPRQIVDAIVDKQGRNESRIWPDWRTAGPDKAIEHDRSGDAA